MSEFRAGIPFRLDGLRNPIFRILGHNPGSMTGPGTNSYLIGHNRRCLLAPGPDDEQQLGSLLAALHRLGGGTEEELLREVYAGIAAHLWPRARRIQLAYLLKLQRAGRAALAAGQWRALA